MPKRDPVFFLVDMLIAIDMIQRHAKTVATVEELIKSELICSLVTKQLEIIGEAMNQVLDCEQFKSTAKPTWRYVVNFRNVVVHEYFGLNYDLILDIIKHDILDLEQELYGFILDYVDRAKLKEVVEKATVDLKKMHREEGALYLEQLRKKIFS